jgi:putative Mg2+ transporter-C (MgtC) family protein
MEFAVLLDPNGMVYPLGLATIMGLTVGIERSIRGRPAGLRTYLLVCVSFTVIALLSESHFLHQDQGFRPDPARLAAGGLAGIGFLGAGVIVRSRFTVFGLTTAAGIWTVAVTGLALGSRNYPLAFGLFVIAFGSLWLLRYLEPALPRETFRQITLRMRGDGMTFEEAREFFARYRLALDRVTIEKDKQSRTANYTFVLRSKHREAFVEAFNMLLQREEVHYGQLQEQDQQEPEETDESSNS